jgi:hypothetical protein
VAHDVLWRVVRENLFDLDQARREELSRAGETHP